MPLLSPLTNSSVDLTLRQPPTSYEDAFQVLKKALALGANFWNAGQIYGPKGHTSLELLHAYFTKYPEDKDKVVISVKSCYEFAEHKPYADPVSIRQYIDACLSIADGKFFIDVFEPARIDPQVPIVDSVRAIAEYVQAGKIGGIGLSEVDAETIHRAAQVHPIAAVEVELSLFTTDPLHNGVAAACKQHDIPLVAYSPLSRGFLTGTLRKFEDMDETDYRHRFPRYSKENFPQNMKLVDAVEHVAKQEGYTLPQVAIAWTAAQSAKPNMPTVIPIPGATNVSRTEENTRPVQLKPDEVERLDAVLKQINVAGGRYPVGR